MQTYETMLCPATANNPRYGEGSALQLDNGDLLLIYGEFYTSIQGDMGAAHLLGRISKNNGREWGQPFVVVENDAITLFSAGLLRLPSGRFILAYCRKATVEGGITVQGVEGASCIPWLRYSDDEGKTWSDPWPVSCAASADHWTMNNDRLVRHSSGRLLMPVSPLMPRGDGNPYYSSSMCVYSDDEGLTWQKSATELRINAMDGLQEPCVVERRDGSLLMFMRTSLGHQYRSTSRDRGQTWIEAVAVPELVSPVSPVSVKRIPANGDLLAIFNKNYDPIGAYGPCAMGLRTPLTATISQDDGETWTYLRNIENEPKLTFDYTSITFLDTDEVMLTYHSTQFFGELKKWRRSMKLKILPVGWFYEGSGSGAYAMPPWPYKSAWPLNNVKET